MREQAQGRGHARCGRPRRIASPPARSGAKAEAAVHGFLKLIEQLAAEIAGLELHEQVDHVINS